MYTYYCISSFKHETVIKVANRLKPLITIMQLLQFGVIITHCTIAVLPDCSMSYFFHLQILNFLVLTVLFGQFFVQTYLMEKKNSKRKFLAVEPVNLQSENLP